MIIVGESFAKSDATSPRGLTRTDISRSSTAHNNTPGQMDARPIGVRDKEVVGSNLASRPMIWRMSVSPLGVGCRWRGLCPGFETAGTPSAPPPSLVSLRDSSPWWCTIAVGQAIMGSFCCPIGRSTHRKLTEILSARAPSLQETMPRVVVVKLWFARDDPPRLELTCYPFPRWMRQPEGTPIRIANTGRIGASGCRSAVPRWSASPRFRERARPL